MELSTLKAILKVWGIQIPKLNAENGIDERIKVQKLMYLLQGRQKSLRYLYNIYIRGPYSPSLSQDYYDLASRLSEITAGSLPEDTRVNLETVKRDADEFSKMLDSVDDVASLELLATTLFFGKHYSTESKIVEAVQSIKPKFSREQVQAALNFLVQNDYSENYGS
ncbi:hypothetical protein J7J84_05660 [bacterium]|nr:hypothetical protein [bacterium]